VLPLGHVGTSSELFVYLIGPSYHTAATGTEAEVDSGVLRLTRGRRSDEELKGVALPLFGEIWP